MPISWKVLCPSNVQTLWLECADIVVNVVSSILDEFCCQVGNVSSMELSSIMLKLLHFLVGTRPASNIPVLKSIIGWSAMPAQC